MTYRKYLSWGSILLVVSMLVVIWLIPLVTTFLTALKTPQEAARTYPWQSAQGFALRRQHCLGMEASTVEPNFVLSLFYAGIGAGYGHRPRVACRFLLDPTASSEGLRWFLLIYAALSFRFKCICCRFSICTRRQGCTTRNLA